MKILAIFINLVAPIAAVVLMIIMNQEFGMTFVWALLFYVAFHTLNIIAILQKEDNVNETSKYFLRRIRSVYERRKDY
jgi:hypothetical protein